VNLLIRVDANQISGLGHFKRSLWLAENLVSQGFDVLMVLSECGPQIKREIKSNSLKYFILKSSSLLDEVTELQQNGFSWFDAVFLDISHRGNLTACKDVEVYLRELLKVTNKRVVFDGMEQDMLMSKVNETVEFAILPYVGSENSKVPNSKKQLLGTKFFVLPKTSFPQDRSRKKKPEHLLISFGGSDPACFSELTLKALTTVSISCRIKLVLGETFSSERRKEIQFLAQAIVNLEVIPAQPSLFPLYSWADIAVIGSGLSKYEAAAYGLPCLHLSFDSKAEKINKAFCNTGAAIDLGSQVSAEQLAIAINEFYQNDTLRCEMARKGHQLVDEHGSNRIINAVF